MGEKSVGQIASQEDIERVFRIIGGANALAPKGDKEAKIEKLREWDELLSGKRRPKSTMHVAGIPSFLPRDGERACVVWCVDGEISDAMAFVDRDDDVFMVEILKVADSANPFLVSMGYDLPAEEVGAHIINYASKAHPDAAVIAWTVHHLPAKSA